MKKRVIAMMLAAAMVLGLCACGSGSGSDAGEGETVTLRLSHPRADGSTVDEAVKAFVANATAADSSLDIAIYPAAQLGDYTSVQEQISVGDVDMQLATLGTSVDKYFGIASAPYICSNWDEAKAIFASGSEFTDSIAAHLEDMNIKLMAVYPMYFGGMVLNKEPGDLTDLSKGSGYKVRCQQMKGPELVTKMLGYNATPMALSDCFTSLQTGVIDGMIGSGAEGYYSDYRDVADNYIAYNDHFEVWYMIMSMDTWNKLSESQQKAVADAAAKLEADRWEVAPTATAEFEQKLADYGVNVINFTDDEIAAFNAKCAEEVWPELTELYGQEAVDLIAKLKANL